MTSDDLLKGLCSLRCEVHGADLADNEGHRHVLLATAQAFNRPDVAILCEPCLILGRRSAPDIVVVDPASGVHVIEVKAYPIGAIEDLRPGGSLIVHYRGVSRDTHPLKQVERQMYAIKDAARAECSAVRSIPFSSWVAFPSISRAAWELRWDERVMNLEQALFEEDIQPQRLADRLLGRGRRFLATQRLTECPVEQLRAVFAAFGGRAELPREADPSKPSPSLGARFDAAASKYKRLSEEQQKLADQAWDEGPRLIRGVAGSGKTVVLAHNLARRMARAVASGDTLFSEVSHRFLAVCFNRTLVPFLREKIEGAFRLRSEQEVPEDMLTVQHINGLASALAARGLWKYIPVKSQPDAGARARGYLEQLESADPELRASLQFDAIYVDEGQDLYEDEFRLLRSLCRVRPGREPNVFVFYDDAQNVYARQRPNWQSLGLNISGGRSSVMGLCFRNTRQIVDPAFNMLLGSHARSGRVQTRTFADLYGLRQRGLVEEADGVVRVHFAPREGLPVRVTGHADSAAEAQAVAERVRELLVGEQVRPEDILILANSWAPLDRVAAALAEASLPIAGLHQAHREKDGLALRPGHLALSTVYSAKGYDAYVVLAVAAEEYRPTDEGRAAFYVACTRARELLEVSSVGEAPLVEELRCGGSLAAAASA